MVASAGNNGNCSCILKFNAFPVCECLPLNPYFITRGKEF
jgi:hypothetical protein